jgi:hypothetical protein
LTARNFICPATEVACNNPNCKRDACRELERENDAFLHERLARVERVPTFVMQTHPHQYRWPDVRGIIFVVFLLGSLLLCGALKLMGYKVG